MFEKHVQRFGSNAFLASAERSWLDAHGPIRVGYQDGYLAFCATDLAAGTLTGALKDYLDVAADCLSNAHLDFEPVAFPTAAAALDALKRGEVDCAFPANLGGYDSELMELVMTPSLMRTDMYAVVRQSDLDFFAKKDHVIVAVNQGNPNYVAFLLDHYPGWTAVAFENTAECLKAVADHVADCVLVSSYRINNISRLCDKYNLTTFATGIALDYCFAVNDGDTELYSILAKVVGLVPNSTVSAALSRYITEDARLTFTDFIVDHLAYVIAVTAAVLLVILLLLLRSVRSERRAKRLIAATEADALTGLYNRDYFFQYADRMYRERPDVPRDAIVLNIEQFHSINALNGREFGDRILREREMLDQRLMGDLRRALDSYEFEVYYQPKYNIEGDAPRLVSAEALIRWQHPELGMIAPDAFIPLFERNDAIGEVDKYVWSQAARQIARWRAQFGVTLPVSVNLSRVDVFDPTLEDTLESILAQNGLTRDALKLEVTESAYTENADQVIRVVEGLRRKGYVVEMDDFGTGYSSLNMLFAMPIDVLKMDKTFIQNIENDERDTQLVALIIGIAKNLNIPVIAEGVETESQLKLLKKLGCMLVQGYYFSRPLHPSDFEAEILQGE